MATLKEQTESRKNISKFGTCLGNYIEDNYQEFMTLASNIKNKEEIIIKLKDAKENGYSVSDKYLNDLANKIKNANNANNIQYYLTNILLAASGNRI